MNMKERHVIPSLLFSLLTVCIEGVIIVISSLYLFVLVSWGWVVCFFLTKNYIKEPIRLPVTTDFFYFLSFSSFYMR